MHIATFVPFDFAAKIIRPSEDGNGTFALRSLRSYRIEEEVEGDATIGDSKEGTCSCIKDGKVRHCETCATVMVSCWTIIKDDYVTEEHWMSLYDKGKEGRKEGRFACPDGIAIVSTVDKVKGFLENNNSRLFLGKERPFKHGPVQCYGTHRTQPDSCDRILDPAFVKADRYVYQEEYRFAFALPDDYAMEKLVYYVANPRDYMDMIQFGPEMKCQKKRELLRRTFGAYVELLDHPNYDDLQKAIRCPLIKYQEDRK